MKIDLIYWIFHYSSYPLAENVVEICQYYHSDWEATEKFEKVSNIVSTAALTFNPFAQEKIHVHLKEK